VPCSIECYAGAQRVLDSFRCLSRARDASKAVAVASEIADSSSSGSSWAFPGTAPLVSTAAGRDHFDAVGSVEHLLADGFARFVPGYPPYGRRTSRGPPVMQITLPAARMRGPGMRPAAIASRTSIATLPCNRRRARTSRRLQRLARVLHA